MALVFVRPAAQTAPIILDHASLPLFEQIPTAYEDVARGLRLQMADRSVGGNISAGLDCLAQDYATAPTSCKTNAAGTTGETWSHAYPRANWQQWWEPMQGPPEWQMASPKFNGMWTGLQPGWIDWLTPRLGNYDVVSFQFNYLSSLGANVADYFTNHPTPNADAADFEALRQAIAPKRVVYWTTSLSKADPSPGDLADLNAFNTLRRSSVPGGEVLIDFAALISHRPDGSLCATSGGVPRICDEYSTETNGGHLSYGWGKVRAAKLVWIAMARLAGWTPGGSDTEPPSLGIDCSMAGCGFLHNDNVGVTELQITVTARDEAGNQTTQTQTVTP